VGDGFPVPSPNFPLPPRGGGPAPTADEGGPVRDSAGDR
jgi:hypothetical protein